jgi:hypothetical protein
LKLEEENIIETLIDWRGRPKMETTTYSRSLNLEELNV